MFLIKITDNQLSIQFWAAIIEKHEYENNNNKETDNYMKNRILMLLYAMTVVKTTSAKKMTC